MVRVIQVLYDNKKGEQWMMVALCSDTKRDLSNPKEREKQKEEDTQRGIGIMNFIYSDRLQEHLKTHEETLKHGSFEEKMQVYMDYASKVSEYYKDKERRKGWKAD